MVPIFPLLSPLSPCYFPICHFQAKTVSRATVLCSLARPQPLPPQRRPSTRYVQIGFSEPNAPGAAADCDCPFSLSLSCLLPPPTPLLPLGLCLFNFFQPPRPKKLYCQFNSSLLPYTPYSLAFQIHCDNQELMIKISRGPPTKRDRNDWDDGHPVVRL